MNKLTAAAKEALAQGDVLLGHAYELCRLREHEQNQALDFLFEKGDRGAQVQTRNGWKPVGRCAVPVADLRVWIQNTLMLDLAKAPFDTADATLNPKAGACGACPHRTGDAPILFADIKSGRRMHRSALLLRQAQCRAGSESRSTGKRTWPQVHLEDCGWVG